MKLKGNSIFTRIGVFMFTLITVLSVLFIGITFLATTHFYEASTQLLNKDVAAHIAKFTSPFEKHGINKQKADSVFYNAMVINPNDEVYFLDTTGKVIAYHSPDSLIKQWQLPLDKIKEHIDAGGEDYVKGPDPKDPSALKIFSAAQVNIKGKNIGYIYVILGSNQYRNVTDLLTSSHITSLAIEAFGIIIILSFLLTLIYFKRLQGKFNGVITTVERFKNGDYQARFAVNSPDELNSIMLAFNGLAERLQLTIGQLQQSENERKDFITNISHDLLTPLSVAKGYTETLLLQENLGKDAVGYLQLVENKIQVVEKLVMQLFELAKMDSVEFKAQKEPFVIGEILKEIVDSWQPAAQKKHIALACTGCENASMIFADISMMEKVMHNLMGNAFKFTPEGGYIRIQLTHDNEQLIIRFSNNGPEIPANIIDWISNDNNGRGTRPRPTGSGLGLAIIKRILKLHGFPLTVSSGSENVLSFRMKIYCP